MSYKLLYCVIFLCGLIVIRLHYLDYRVIRFNEYLRKFNKSYSKEEFQRRMLIFEESLEEIRRLNDGESSTGAVYGLNKFSDWHRDEIYNVMLQKDDGCASFTVPPCYNCTAVKRSGVIIPERLDWRKYPGVIGPVLDQKQCNGCWAFGIVGVMEAMAAIDKIGYDRLSVQQLIDCSTVNRHCRGGNIDTALHFLCRTRLNLTTEYKYPLKLVDEDCKTMPNGKRGVKNYGVLCNLDDDTIIKRLVVGPVIIEVKPNGWMNYIGGIITRNCVDKTDGFTHIVQIVGYDTATDEDNNIIPFFIIKNSFGSDWGEDGYIRIARGKKLNLCGIYDHMAWLDVI